MRRLNTVTLLCLDTRDPEGAVQGMKRCMAELEFADAILLTHDQYRCDDPRIKVQAVPELRGIEDYSHFMVKDIGRYFSTSHVLVAQWDGFVVNPQLWEDTFLDYDYIGAPWVNRRFAVGNGGFSLRSRKLVDALQDPRMHLLNPEDYAICERYHDLLEADYGIRFAPVSVASRFSCEMYVPPHPTFGAHSIGCVHWVLSDEAHLKFLKSIPSKQLRGGMGRTIAKDCIDTGKVRSAAYLIEQRWAHGKPAQKLDALKLKLKLWLNLKKKRAVQYQIDETSIVDHLGSGGAPFKAWFKKHIQRGLVLRFSGQRALQKNTIPTGARKVLWLYEWYMLGDCILNDAQRQYLAGHHQIDICVPAGPLDVFENDPLFHRVYRNLSDCPQDYDFILINDINSRTIRQKIKRYRDKPWAAIINDPRQDAYTRVEFVSSRIEQLLGMAKP